MSAKAEKELICVPIVHTAADMGGLARSVRRLAVRKLGRQAWKQNVDVISQMWADIRRTVEGIEPHLAKDIRVTYPIYKPRHPRRGTR